MWYCLQNDNSSSTVKHVQKRGKYHKKRKSQPEFKLHNEKVKFYGQLLGYGV